LLGCFSQVIPDQVPAASCGQLLVMNFAGKHATGQYFVASEIGAGGMGGRRGLDGLDAIESDATTCMNVPAESLEREAPMRVVSWSLSPDSGGAGRWRGGVGTSKTFEINSDEITANYRGERHSTSPWGSQGGSPAALTSASVLRSSGLREELQSKTMLRMGHGDRLTVNLSGGGGYGSPLERDPEAVLWDVQNKRVTQAAAYSEYGVVIKNDMTIDGQATQQLRTDMYKHIKESNA